ncbi:MAG TPA: DUF2071 domain-containing protein [Actinomycetota bacterium]
MTTTIADPDLAPHPPRLIQRPVMIHRWDRLALVHHPYDPEVIQRLLPSDLQVDTFDGAGWVGIVPFRLSVRLPAWSPAVPWLSTTLETNVRTYVRGPDGRRGIFFFSLDVSRLLAALVAGTWYRIPYRWARLRFERRGSVIRYQSLRREPVPAHLDLQLSVGPFVAPMDLTELERFLVCRWRLYSPRPGGIAVTEVDHEPWPLWRANVVTLEEKMVRSLGLPPIEADSSGLIAHYSSGVEARFNRRRAVGNTRSPLQAESRLTADKAPPRPWLGLAQTPAR